MHQEVVHARGHENVTATHASTVEVTSDDYLTPAGDCILAVEADRMPADFDEAFVAACQDADATIRADIEVGADRSDEAEGGQESERGEQSEAGEGTDRADGGDDTVTIRGRGDPALTFESERSLVGRTSEYVDDRTVLLEADRAAGDLPRKLVEALADGAAMKLRLTVD
ncbi:MAG: DUF371 domain-containing protein [Haloarculaceae archaeon]